MYDTYNGSNKNADKNVDGKKIMTEEDAIRAIDFIMARSKELAEEVRKLTVERDHYKSIVDGVRQCLVNKGEV